MEKTQNRFDTRKLVLLALLTAITIVLQVALGVIRLGPFQFAVVLVPIVIGAALCGVWAGGWLGLAFGLAVLFNGDAAAFLQVNAFGTILTVLIKGAAAGLVSGAVYRLFESRGKYPAALASAIAAPIVNTGIFALGCYAFFLPTISEWAGGSENATQFIFVTLIGVNFIIEFVVNIVLSPIIVRIINNWQDRKA
jgi:uncharacterized membrane protein